VEGAAGFPGIRDRLLRSTLCGAYIEENDVMSATLKILLLSAWTNALLLPAGDKSDAHFQANVDMVVLTLSVTDSKGNYVTGLKSEDLRIEEDGIPQQIKAFTEGARSSSDLSLDLATGTKVFVLFDTSNWMYDKFAYASDAIADFVRRLDDADSIAVYKFSRNLYRAVSLTRDHDEALSAVRTAVAGDDTALYNTLLLTIRDTARVAGKKAIVVFSNGPDNASMVTPDDVLAVAQDGGIPIYIVSTHNEQKDPLTKEAFQRLTARSGGRLFWAESWQKQTQAFTSVRADLANLYTVAYYPVPNDKQGFRRITVDIVSPTGKNYRVRTREGYRAQGQFPIANVPRDVPARAIESRTGCK
jgi:Ca-activated chloride channel family protein